MGLLSAFLSARQRAAPAANDTSSPRRNVSSGGIPFARGRTLIHGIEDNDARYPATVYDAQIVRDRGPFVRRPRVIPPGDGWVDWTRAGPLRPELHMRNVSMRTMVGNSASRYPVVDTPSTGRHTMSPAGTARTAERYVVTAQIMPGRQNRLAASQQRGNTFSQLTVPQGGRK